MNEPNVRPERVLVLRFGVEPKRIEVLQVLARASDDFRSRRGACDVLVDASRVGGLDLTLDVEFLSWIVVHYAQLRSFAIVLDDLDCCTARLRKLEKLSGKTFAIFAAEPEATAWLESRPWPLESV